MNCVSQLAKINSELGRLATYYQANFVTAYTSRLARVGFFYKNERVVCFSCQLSLDPCQLDVDCVEQLHQKLSPRCSFLTKGDDTNVGRNKEPWTECEGEFAFHCKSLSDAILKSSIWTVYVDARTRADRRNVFEDLNLNNPASKLDDRTFSSEKSATLCRSSNLQPLDTSSLSQEGIEASREIGLHRYNGVMLTSVENEFLIDRGIKNHSESAAASANHSEVSFARAIGKCSESELSTSQAAVSTNQSAAFVQQPAASINRSVVSVQQPAGSIGQSASSIRQPAVSIQAAPSSNFPVPTPVTAPIDRTKPDFDLLKRESVRLSTYYDWPQTAKIQPLVLAKEGFFYAGCSDRVQCVFCREHLRNWVVGDDPSREHRRHFPNCSFVRRKDRHNIADVSNPSSHFQDKLHNPSGATSSDQVNNLFKKLLLNFNIFINVKTNFKKSAGFTSQIV